MARYHVPQMSEFPYHVTARSRNRERFPIPLSEMWKLFNLHLSKAHYKNDLKIHSFVLMPNHIHLLCRTGEIAIGRVMAELLGELSKEVNIHSGRINQNWGTRHNKTVVESPHYFLNAHKYVYQNPLRAGLCQRVEAWPYSTLHGLLGLSKLEVPLEPDTILFNPEFDENELKWLNRLPSAENLDCFRKALKKRKFKLPKIHRTQPHELEHQRL